MKVYMRKIKQFLSFITSIISLSIVGAVPAFAQSVNVKPNIAPNIEVGGLISAVINLLFVVASVIAIVFLIWGGIRWILSGGDKAAVETARNTIIAAIIGLVIVFLSYFILKLVFQFLGLTLLDTFNIPNALNSNIR